MQWEELTRRKHGPLMVKRARVWEDGRPTALVECDDDPDDDDEGDKCVDW